jgi:DNA-directed RNA polymerase subunit K/omega
MADNDIQGTDAAQAENESPAPPITSRFLFVDVAAQRAKQLRRGALPRIERQPTGPHKLERVAMEEVRHGAIQYTLPTGYSGEHR